MNEHEPDRPFRAGVFDTVPLAEEAVRALLAEGFSVEQITVVDPMPGYSDYGKLPGR